MLTQRLTEAFKFYEHHITLNYFKDFLINVTVEQLKILTNFITTRLLEAGKCPKNMQIHYYAVKMCETHHRSKYEQDALPSRGDG